MIELRTKRIIQKLPILFGILGLFFHWESHAQTLGPDFWYQELARRAQLSGVDTSGRSFLLRSFSEDPLDSLHQGTSALQFIPSPVFINARAQSDRAYGTTDFGMIPTPGIQASVFAGFSLRYKFIRLDLQPEGVIASNPTFSGYPSDFSHPINLDKFRFWNFADYPERFGNGPYSSIDWGQSSLMLGFGSFEAGISTKNNWWGPGQWNSLIFSTNAPGFVHLTIKTRRPAKTFLGTFEGQVLSGRLEDSGFSSVQDSTLNARYFRPFTGDWRYVNALTINYTPKWIPSLSIGLSRTFQVYQEGMGTSFYDYFPIFEAFQKEKFFENGNSVNFDANARDQQVAVFARVRLPKAKAELYFEFGKRDHNFNWREFILNPEHARAYLFGFSKLFPSPIPGYQVQLRSELVHQQESINRILRYGIKGGASWHTHGQARGFAHRGQPLGVGLGIGSNSQVLEVALVNQFDKFGILLERLANHQDFYYRAFGQQSERKPWVDLSLGLLFDKQFDKLLLSSKVQVIHARNYQWQLDPASTPEYPKGKNLTSVMAQVSAIYLWNSTKRDD